MSNDNVDNTPSVGAKNNQENEGGSSNHKISIQKQGTGINGGTKVKSTGNTRRTNITQEQERLRYQEVQRQDRKDERSCVSITRQKE